MSLNGLDAAKVDEAYQAALAEAGGWFLLQYISRDEVDLLRAGNGGVVDVRDAISQYEAKSPLYGFVQYRRRKVLLKYVPEGTSRLLQARVAVHFQSITERFTPHDTVFSVISPSDLKETAVSSACSLHTATGSISSSNSSLRRRRLQEISEDAEENQSTALGNEKDTPPRSLNKHPSEERDVAAGDREHTVEEREIQEKAMWRKERDVLCSETVRQERHHHYVPATPAPSLEEQNDTDLTGRKSDQLPRSMREPRTSSQSTRPTTRDLYGAYVYKPKVKLGPRPSTESTGRPHTSASNSRQMEPRPISTVPAGIKVPSRRPILTRPQSQHSSTGSKLLPLSSAAPKLPELLFVDQGVNTAVTANTKVIPGAPSPMQPAMKSSAITPEKQRLMKALQLRKKQLAMAAASKEEEKKPIERLELEAGSLVEGQQQDVENIPDILEHPTRGDSVSTVRVQPEVDEESGSPIPTSSPVSIIEPSEGHSTQASSFTDDNDHSAKDAQRKELQPTDAPSLELSSSCSVVDMKSADLDEPKQADSPLQPVKETSASEVPLPPPTEEEAQMLVEEAAPVLPTSNASLNEFMEDVETAVTHMTNIMQNIDEDFTDTRPSTADTIERQDLERPSKRRGLIDPIRIISSAENSDDNYLSDESFMEELKTAKLQEAKPVSVSKSPLTPMSPRSINDRRPSDAGSAPRSVSNPLQNGISTELPYLSHDGYGYGYTRSMSVSCTNVAKSQQASTLMAKKINVSSGISKRIKALELVSSRETSPATQSPLSTAIPCSSPPFAEFRKASLRTPSGRSNLAGKRETELSNVGSYPSPSPSPQVLPSCCASPESVLDVRHEGITSKAPPGSISVTARILRGANNAKPVVPVDASEPVIQDLFRSPLVIEHQGAMVLPSGKERRGSDGPHSGTSSSPRSGRNSMFRSASQPDVVPKRNSISSRRKHSVGSPYSIKDTSSTDLGSLEQRGEEKKESRKSRLLKRMSSISSASRKSLLQALSPTPKEEESIIESQLAVESLPAVVDIGDVNIQFPDTLLWKRRHLMVDDQGYLILSPTKAEINSRSTTKRYQLSEFRIPYMPDHDRQELPNSVYLDFCDGTTLQLACENPSGQAMVLRTLKDAHGAYHRLFGQPS